VQIDESMADTPYWDVNGKSLFSRADGTQIGTKYLKERWDEKEGTKKS